MPHGHRHTAVIHEIEADIWKARPRIDAFFKT